MFKSKLLHRLALCLTLLACLAMGCDTEESAAGSPEEQCEALAADMGIQYNSLSVVESASDCCCDCLRCPELPSGQFCFLDQWPDYCESVGPMMPDASLPMGR